MSVKEYNRAIIISDTETGQIITTIDKKLYKPTTIMYMLTNIIDNYINEDEHGILIKVGYKS